MGLVIVLKEVLTMCNKIVKKLRNENNTIAFMESCTGGFLANCITNISGSSDVLKMSLITYSNKYKIYFGVDEQIILKHGVYSLQTAEDMSKKVAKIAESDFAIGITGQLCEPDKNNLTNNENEVYYSIYDVKNDKIYTEVIKLKKNERKDLKIEIAKKIFERMSIVIWTLKMKNTINLQTN